MAITKKNRIMELMKEIHGWSDWWIQWVSNVNEDASTDGVLEKITGLAAEMRQVHESRF